MCTKYVSSYHFNYKDTKQIIYSLLSAPLGRIATFTFFIEFLTWVFIANRIYADKYMGLNNQAVECPDGV